MFQLFSPGWDKRETGVLRLIELTRPFSVCLAYATLVEFAHRIALRSFVLPSSVAICAAQERSIKALYVGTQRRRRRR